MHFAFQHAVVGVQLPTVFGACASQQRQQHADGQAQMKIKRTIQRMCLPAVLRHGSQLPAAARHFDIHQQRLAGKHAGIAIHHLTMRAQRILAANGQADGRRVAGAQQAVDMGDNRHRAPVMHLAASQGKHGCALDQRAATLHQLHRPGQDGMVALARQGHRAQLLGVVGKTKAQLPLVASTWIDHGHRVIRGGGDIAHMRVFANRQPGHVGK